MSENEINYPEWAEREEEQDDYSLREYDITAAPNDFNILTLFSFIESGAVKIPGFQRNYVWDIKRASRLIESLLIGLPIPQIFLYEEGKNRFLVIDGQQRLMSVYYFIHKRFPREEKRAELRQIFDQHGGIPSNILDDDKYFTKFNLRLTDPVAGRKNRLNGLNYETLADSKTSFDLKTIRNVIIKQNSPDDGDSSIYEVFNRLNSGGINLTAQEIRTSLYHSRFYDMLYRLNLRSEWRKLLGLEQPDLHMRDVEILLRGFAMMMEGDSYTPSMKRFLNIFSKKAKQMFGVSAGTTNRESDSDGNPTKQAEQLQRLDKAEKCFNDFISVTKDFPARAFYGTATGKFNISIFEAVFTAMCRPTWLDSRVPVRNIDVSKLETLKGDPEFLNATQKGTAQTANVQKRLERARVILG
ncbi:MAG TPA: DUF262 domain-containing protein [Pseudomonadales bacterium]|nr:DUF262 domain-containing protein [Pseudomonadales bacterium]